MAKSPAILTRRRIGVVSPIAAMSAAASEAAMAEPTPPLPTRARARRRAPSFALHRAQNPHHRTFTEQCAVGTTKHGVARSGYFHGRGHLIEKPDRRDLVRHCDQRAMNVGQTEHGLEDIRVVLGLDTKRHHDGINAMFLEIRIVDHRRFEGRRRVAEMRDQRRRSADHTTSGSNERNADSAQRPVIGLNDVALHDVDRTRERARKHDLPATDFSADGMKLVDEPGNPGGRMPMIPADTPVSSIMPFFDNVAPTHRISMSIGPMVRPPTTMAPNAALSAMVSTIARHLGAVVDDLQRRGHILVARRTS